MEYKLREMIEVIEFTEDIKIHSFCIRANYFVNSVIIECPTSLVIYDTQHNYAYGCQLRKYAEKLNKDIVMVIIGHAHIDHYGGMEAFYDLPTFSDANIIDELKEKGKHLSLIPKFTLKKEFKIDNISFEVTNIKEAHALNHIVLWIKELSVVVVGDLAQYNGHLLVYKYDKFIEGLEYINSQKNNYTNVVSGHGSISNFATIAENIEYLKSSYEIAKKTSSIEELDKMIKEKYPNRSTIKVNLGYLLFDKLLPQK